MAMKLKYKVRQTSAGKWAVWKNKTHYFTDRLFETEVEAIKSSLYLEGGELVDKINDVQKRMESVPGMIDERDPHGWRA